MNCEQQFPALKASSIPSGYATMKPWESAVESISLTPSWISAVAVSPWKLSTRGVSFEGS